MSRRDIYYKDPVLFKRQSVVDKLVDDLAATFDLDRSDLGVRASSKGLFAGSGLTIRLRSGGTVLGNDYDSALIPCNAEIKTLEIRQDIAFVLVVEKEAVFQTLCRIGFSRHELLIGSGIIVTGKGYPDVATRELVNTFSNELPDSIPILALVDADPHGIEILSVFKYGSLAMNHQKNTLSSPRMQWIGVFASELRRYSTEPLLVRTSTVSARSSFGVSEQDMIPLTKLDHKKAEIEIISNATVPTSQLYQEGLLADDYESRCDLASEQATITGSTLLAVYLASKINAAMNAARTVIALSLSEGTLMKEEPSL
ncbi:endodeoxyribonuclease [Tulasnella sp. 427]|nr:endodeoxyribonuclease [Tulasnella sp. 427]